MTHNIVYRRPLRRVIIQNLRDQVSGTFRDGDIIGKVVSVHSDPLVSGLDIRCLKRRLANDESVDNDTDGPDIDLIRVTLLALEDFGRNIVRGTTDSALALTVELEFRC